MKEKSFEQKDGFYARKKGFENLDGVIIAEGETLEKLHKTLLEMLGDIIDVCEENNIFYTLSGGSVLGAIRHKGFIPWDDDVDINMPRADFEKLKKIFKRKLGDKYSLCAPELTKGHGMASSQIQKKGTIYRSYNELSKKNPGICIDIFVLENVPDNAIHRKLHGYHCLAAGYFLTCRKTLNDLPYLDQYLSQNPALKSGFMKKARLGRLISWIPLDKVAKHTKKVYSKCKDNNTKYVSIPGGRKHYFGEMYLRSDMCESIEAEFEGMKVRIPKGYKRYMKALYGDTYMQLPPPEKRERHPLMELDFGE